MLPEHVLFLNKTNRMKGHYEEWPFSFKDQQIDASSWGTQFFIIK